METAAPGSSSKQQWQPALVPTLIACLSTAMLTAFVIHTIDPVFKFPNLPELGLSPSVELVEQHHQAQIDFRQRNYATYFGIGGLVIGAGLGLVTARKRRLLSTVLAAVATGAAGALAAYLTGLQVAKYENLHSDPTLSETVVLHVSVWVPLCAVACFCVALLHDGIQSAIFHGVIGATAGLLIALVINIAIPFLFTFSNLILLVPTATPQRFIQFALAGSLLALVLTVGASRLQIDQSKPVIARTES